MPGAGNLSSLPFVAQTLTLPDANTLVYPNPAPYSNTKELVMVNLSDQAIYAKIVPYKVTQASITLFCLTASPFIAGDNLLFDGGTAVLTAVAGARTPGNDDFDCTLTGLALVQEIEAAINDPLNSWATIGVASANSYSVASTTIYFVSFVIDSGFAEGALSNGYTLDVNSGINAAVSPGNTQNGVTSGGFGAVPVAGDVTEANSHVILARSASVLSIGPEGDRNDLSDISDNSGLRLVFKAASGTDVKLNLTYVQTIGGGGRNP